MHTRAATNTEVWQILTEALVVGLRLTEQAEFAQSGDTRAGTLVPRQIQEHVRYTEEKIWIWSRLSKLF